MAFIEYVPDEAIPPEHRVSDTDNIIRVHAVHPETMRHHLDLYREVMHADSPLTRIQREMIALVVSAANACRY